jgi:hypothetical protein
MFCVCAWTRPAPASAAVVALAPCRGLRPRQFRGARHLPFLSRRVGLPVAGALTPPTGQPPRPSRLLSPLPGGRVSAKPDEKTLRFSDCPVAPQDTLSLTGEYMDHRRTIDGPSNAFPPPFTLSQDRTLLTLWIPTFPPSIMRTETHHFSFSPSALLVVALVATSIGLRSNYGFCARQQRSRRLVPAHIGPGAAVPVLSFARSPGRPSCGLAGPH